MYGCAVMIEDCESAQLPSMSDPDEISTLWSECLSERACRSDVLRGRARSKTCRRGQSHPEGGSEGDSRVQPAVGQVEHVSGLQAPPL